MSQIFKDIKVELDEELEEKLKLLMPNLDHFYITRKSVDARRSGHPHFVYSVEAYAKGERDAFREEVSAPLPKIDYKGSRPLIIGAGPAGLFAAVRLVERGIKPVLFEQGAECKTRILHINKHWRYGELNPLSNVCFGEGGAGLYSDGKLITRIKSPYIKYVMNRLVKFGAPAEIEYLANPHVGSDRIRRVIPKIREFLIKEGCEIYFNAKVKTLLVENKNIKGLTLTNGQSYQSDYVILATGHSAEDMFHHLRDLEVYMEGKSFALGLRIEHAQDLINKIQYRDFAGHEKLGSANYKLTHHDHKTGIGVYSFCMCPGGYTISSSTEADAIVCNGMSNYNRNGPFANAAIVVTVDHQKNFGSKIFGGLEFRRSLETKAHQAVIAAGGKKELPVQNTMDFLNRKSGAALSSSSPSGVVATRLDQVLPGWISQKIATSLEKFDRSMKGFLTPNSQLHGIESRTSCPVRITRDKVTLQSLSHKGLYPCGEGAGYAGGITSAAVDGVKVAEAIFELVK